MSADKFRNACVAYSTAAAEVRRLKRVIGAAANACYAAQGEPNEPVAHLTAAYAFEWVPDGSGYGRERDYAHHCDDVRGYLAETCVHCLAAHDAIQERKKARRALGIAKRRIATLGRNALSAMEKAE